MARANTIQTNFTAGEVSPALLGRIDINKYFNGVKSILNFVIKPQGGAYRRAGTRYTAEVKTSANHTILREFIFSNQQAYVLEFGNLYMRVYKITAFSLQAEIVTPWATADLDDLYFTQSADILYVAHPSYKPKKISRTSDVSWTLTDYAYYDGPYLDIGDLDNKITISGVTDASTAKSTGTPFVVGDVGKFLAWREGTIWKLGVVTAYVSSSQVTIDQQENVKYPNEQAKITTDGSGNTVSDLSGVFDVSYVGNYVRLFDATWRLTTSYTSEHKVPSNSAISMTGAVFPTNIVKVTGRVITATLTSQSGIFASTDVGRWVRLQFGASIVPCQITAYSSSTSVSVTCEAPIPVDRSDGTQLWNGGVADAWRLGAWSDTTGWPSLNCFHEQRLWWGRTSTQPQTLFSSKSGDYENMAPTELDLSVLADSAIVYTVASNRANPIAWMETGPTMLVGTIGAEFQLKATNLNEAITPQNIDMKEQSRYGALDVEFPHRIGSAVLFLQRGGWKLREMAYDFSIDAFVSKDITIISDHILRQGSGAIRKAYQQNATSIVWVVLTDGTLASMTYDKEQDVIAWSRQQIGGNAVAVESICAVPTLTGSQDLVYMIVRRTVNGSVKRYIERLDNNFDTNDFGITKSYQFYVDCGTTVVASAGSGTVAGFDQLKGDTVQVMMNGVYLGKQVVDNFGQVTINNRPANALVHVGYGSVCYLQTLNYEGGSQAGTSQGKTRRITYLDIQVKDTLPFRHGVDISLSGTKLRTVDAFSDIFTGVFRVTLDQAYTKEPGFYLYQDQPYCLNVLSLMPQLNTNE